MKTTTLPQADRSRLPSGCFLLHLPNEFWRSKPAIKFLVAWASSPCFATGWKPVLPDRITEFVDQNPLGRPFDFAALRSGRTEKQHSPIRAERSRASGGVEARGRP